MRTFIVTKNDSDQRLDKFLSKAVPLLPQSLLYKYLRLKRIKLNGKKSEISTRLCVNDKIELYINDEFFDSSPQKQFLLAPAKLDIVFEDENILLLNKKSGLCVHEDNEHTIDTLINRCLHYLFDNGEYSPDNELSFTPALCNRIDRNTSGIVIVAKNAEALRILNEKIKNREIKKYYLCVVSGIPRQSHAKLTHYLQRNPNESIVKVFEKPNSQTKTIVTEYKVIKSTETNSLLEVLLHTGRTHQIRAHMAYIGHPIIGDGKYGKNSINQKYGQKQQLLCSFKLIFNFDESERTHLLSYLDGKEYSIKHIWFAEELEDIF